MALSLNAEIRTLVLKHPFGISRNTKTQVDNIFVRIDFDGLLAWGEGAPNNRYGERGDGALRLAQQMDLERIQNPFALEEWMAEVNRIDPDGASFSLRAAVDMAVWDLLGKQIGLPLWKLWNAPSHCGPQSSFTIGLDSEPMIAQKLVEAERFPILKVKLGTEHDEDLIRFIRSKTDKPIRVDANEGWKTQETAAKRIRFLATQSIEFIEQPMPAEDDEALEGLKGSSPVPLIADESCAKNPNMTQLARSFHGVNFKLMKTGGLSGAFKQWQEARKLGLKTMVGCMIESSLANTAGAILSLFCDYADLDGFKLIKDDPFIGLDWNRFSQVCVGNAPGLGVVIRPLP